MKFLADMGISISTVNLLVQLGYSAVHVKEIGMKQALDTEIIAKAKNEDRIILTCDLDFGDILAASGDKYPSVIIFRLENETPTNVNKRLTQIFHESSISLREGAIIIAEEARHRVRLLPI
ncbi:MAG: DUF5615 family PIN-like protein [Nitrospirota bacterium]|nr:DUF5615 family PIN-like protein [Nitrospirota bacterium]